MPEVTLVRHQIEKLSKNQFSQLSVFIQKGEVEILLREANGTARSEKLVSSNKKSWTELSEIVNVEFTALSDSCVLHYSLQY